MLLKTDQSIPPIPSFTRPLLSLHPHQNPMQQRILPFKMSVFNILNTHAIWWWSFGRFFKVQIPEKESKKKTPTNPQICQSNKEKKDISTSYTIQTTWEEKMCLHITKILREQPCRGLKPSVLSAVSYSCFYPNTLCRFRSKESWTLTCSTLRSLGKQYRHLQLTKKISGIIHIQKATGTCVWEETGT